LEPCTSSTNPAKLRAAYRLSVYPPEKKMEAGFRKHHTATVCSAKARFWRVTSKVNFRSSTVATTKATFDTKNAAAACEHDTSADTARMHRGYNGKKAWNFSWV
jgi:hypothetical protein